MNTINYMGYDFSLMTNSDHASVHYSKELELALLTAETEYILIDDFKSLFLSVDTLMEQHPVKHLLFDKRNLRTFHQPSMEWYFTVWKQSAKAKGLTSHYKILPKLEWFVQAVNAGKKEIFATHGTEFMEGITIHYVESVEEAVDQLSGLAGA